MFLAAKGTEHITKREYIIIIIIIKVKLELELLLQLLFIDGNHGVILENLQMIKFRAYANFHIVTSNIRYGQ